MITLKSLYLNLAESYGILLEELMFWWLPLLLVLLPLFASSK